MAAIAEIAAEATAEELAPLLGEDITSVVPFEKGISELESLQGALGSGFGVQELIESSIKPLSKTLGATAVAYATLHKEKKGSKMPQMIKVQHEVKKSHYGGSRRYKTGKRTKASRRRKGKTPVSSFKTYTGSSVLSGSSRGKGKITIVSRTFVPRSKALTGGGEFNTKITNDFLNNADGTGGFGMNFKLSDFTQYTDFTAIYRYYKILWVKLVFYPEQNCHVACRVNSGTAATQAFPALDFTDNATAWTGLSPSLSYAPDQTNSTGFSTFDVAMAHDRAKYHMFNDSKELVVFFTPTIKDKVGATSAIDGPSKPQWISTDHADEEHYGLRCWGENFHNSNSLKVLCTMKVAWKHLKH
jgi:hypothetical protein